MKRKSFFVTLSIMAMMGAEAQSYTIEYEERANIANQLKNVTDPETRKRVSAYLSKPTTFYLYYTNGESLYVQEKQKKDSIEELSLKEGTTKRMEIGNATGGIYKNYKTNEYLQDANVLGKEMLVVDKLEKYNWQLIDEQKTIGQYNCKKAKANINGEEVIAWYTEDVPMQEGPRDYYGLPGLIVEVTAEKKTYHAIKIIATKTKLSITKPSEGSVVTKKEYRRILEEKLNELKMGMGGPQGN
jgi:GLPGLI family protein